MTIETLGLRLRSQVLQPDRLGRNRWRAVTQARSAAPDRTLVLVCDMWDRHWSRGAGERVDVMAPQMNRVICALRDAGARIVHAPSDTMRFYQGSPARVRMLAIPRADPPAPREHADPPLPVDASDHGSDTGETTPACVWTRQHHAIPIDEERDGVTDDAREVYNLIHRDGIEQVLLMGVHANMCVLGRGFGIRQLVSWGVEVAFLRDLTDVMYNPAMPPYVSRLAATRLVVGYIERFWCPTVTSGDLLRACEGAPEGRR